MGSVGCISDKMAEGVGGQGDAMVALSPTLIPASTDPLSNPALTTATDHARTWPRRAIMKASVHHGGRGNGLGS